MDMDQAAVFLAGSILTTIGFLVILVGIVVANNIIAKYWKSLGWKLTPSYWDHPTPTFMTPEQAEQLKKPAKEIDKSVEPKL